MTCRCEPNIATAERDRAIRIAADEKWRAWQQGDQIGQETALRIEMAIRGERPRCGCCGRPL